MSMWGEVKGIKEFEALYRKFIDGVRWLNQTAKEKRGEHVQRFEKEIIEPMDKAWLELPERERKEYLAVQVGPWSKQPIFGSIEWKRIRDRKSL